MRAISWITFTLGFLVAFSVGFAVNIVFAQLNLIAEQDAYYAENKEYISDPKNGIHTYTSVCRGYYVETEDGIVGYGDLSDQYTETYEKVSATSTPVSEFDTLR